MKHRILFTFVLFLLSTLALQADNWELFPPDQVTYYHFTGENMDAISPFYVDFIETKNDTDYQYILRNYVEDLSGSCYEILASSKNWSEPNTIHFPNEIIVHQNGWYGETTFDSPNISTPSLIFDAQANIGEVWFIESEQYEDFHQLQIECISIEEGDFLNTLTLIKTFRLQALQNGNPVNSNFDNITFKISEQYGLIEGIPLKELLQNAPNTRMKLVGFEDESGELQGRNSYSILDFVPDFQVGDILKWIHYYYGDFHTFEVYHRDSIISIEKTDTSLVYYFDRFTKEIQTITSSGTVDSINFYTAYNQKQTYSPSNYPVPLNFLYYGLSLNQESQFPDEISIWTTQNLAHNYYNSSLPLVDSTYLHLNHPLFYLIEECDIAVFLGSNFTNYYFHPKAGLVTKKIGARDSKNLIGYRIGNEQGGDIEPIFTNIEPSFHFAEQITFHPNPTNNRFFLQLKNPKLQNLQLTIADIHGQKILQKPLLQSSIEVDLALYSSGIYLVQISDGKNWWVEKVVKY